MNIKLLVVVKAPPHISQKYQETVCVAGVSSNGDWVRIYPINFRQLPVSRKFKKYQWIELDVTPHDKDIRPESYRPVEESIKLLNQLDTKNKNGWSERKKILLPTVMESMEQVRTQYNQNLTSLAMFQPAKIRDIIMSPAEERTAAQSRVQNQLNLFGNNPKQLDHIEYKFKYSFVCKDPTCNGHIMTIEDWEIQELYRTAKAKFGLYAQDKVLGYIKTKWLDEMWSEKKDSYLIVGNVAHTKSFIILGVFWPPKESI